MLLGATFSEDRTKRFELLRDWRGPRDAARTVNFIMLNPSVADGDMDDPTVRKCVGFAKRWGFTRLIVTNLIATVSTDPWDLPPWNGPDVQNHAFLVQGSLRANLVVAAWGTVPSALARTIALAEHIYQLKSRVSTALYCIGRTMSGAPLHPSRARYTEWPEEWWRRESECA